MLCRRGGVGKGDIGAIRIFDRETKFEVRDSAARQFAETVRRGENADPRIEPAAEAPPRRQRYEDGPGRGNAPAPGANRSEEHPARPRRPRREAEA